ncbi:TetR/AcrR family transcriptional regulator [Clostridium sp. C2-6-12]|uniref:TetR/AcrR family transcriptional regulator n=1 Tax=Clostridium sp. C2-6-12 TaxID=2698832 RepID=UPI00136DB4B9|nr:TetR/AcrR family transcriptional regulator [Clostridium sp. C2-6-12]
MNNNWHLNISNKNREEIIETGKELFLKNSFHDVKITDICSKAGVSRVTFYKYFNTVDELIFEVQMDILKRMLMFIKDRSDFTSNGRESLKSVLYAWINFAKEHKEEMKFIVSFDLYYSSHDLNEELKLKYKSFTKEDYNKSLLKHALEKGIMDGSLRENVNASKTGMYIYQTVMGLLQRMSYSQITFEYEPITFEEIATEIVAIIIRSIENGCN